MRANWHYFKSGKRHGPVTFEDLQRLAASGELKDTDEVWRQGSAADWTAARNIPDLFDVPVQTPTPVGILSAPGDNSYDAGERYPSPGRVFPEPKKPKTYFYRLHKDGSVREAALSIPFTELKQYVALGTLKPTDELQEEGRNEWFPASTLFPDLFSNAKPADTTPITPAISEQPNATPKEPVRFAPAESAPQLGIVPEPSRIDDGVGLDSRLMDGPKSNVEPTCDLASPEANRVHEAHTSNLKPCPDCGHMVSIRAKSCPKCGAPQDTQYVCSDCGKSFSIKARTCPHCGAPNEAPPSMSSHPTASVSLVSHRDYGVVPATHGTSGGSWEAVAFACWIAGLGLALTVSSAFLAVVSHSDTWGVVAVLSTYLTLVGGSTFATFVPATTRLRTLAFFNLGFAIFGSVLSHIGLVLNPHKNDFAVLLSFLGGVLLTLWPVGFILFLGAVATYFRNEQLSSSSKRLLLILLGVGILLIGAELMFHRGQSQPTRATLSTAEIVSMFVNGGWGFLVLIWFAVILWRTERMIRKESVGIMAREQVDSRLSPFWSLLSQPDFGWTSPSGKLKVLAVLVVAWAVVSCFAVGRVLLN